ncbi:MAG: TetR/AcrR family transcriptional regulator [Prevotellaceae bacterium]|jgi:AcrR family transcriptional regulator|nr:TetR/AcrR family transcriptional regulator [Prevotellaceae bacterium]
MVTSKEKIIEEAAKAFMMGGYKGSSTTEIAVAAGLSNNSGLFRHFIGKEEMYRAVLSKYVVNVHTPKEKFGDCMGSSLKQFIDCYSEKVEETMDFLYKSLGDRTKKTTNRYFSFMLESAFRNEESAKAIVKFGKEEVELFEEMIEKAKKSGEIRSDVNTRNTAELFRYAFVGLSYTFAMESGATVEQVKKLLHNIYDTIKK